MEPQNKSASCNSFHFIIPNRFFCWHLHNTDPCSASCNIWRVHNEKIDPGNNASSATCIGCNLPLRRASPNNDALERKRSDNAMVLLLESRSNGIICSLYFFSISLRLFLCHFAAVEKVEVWMFSPPVDGECFPRFDAWRALAVPQRFRRACLGGRGI